MHDEPSLSQRAADAVAEWNWETAVRRPDGTSGGGGPVGGGIGNVAGWAVFFGLLGAIVGFILIHSVGGAIFGAVVAGGGIAALGKFLGGGSGTASRKSVIVYTLAGILGGALFGLFMGSPNETKMINAATNWAIFGGLAFGLWRLRRR
ncbi:MAG: hypothetical protein JNK87_33605 [Bryobacterales bacterium]|nr:hypothetical protein [Bryobacterales bacterium]